MRGYFAKSKLLLIITLVVALTITLGVAIFGTHPTYSQGSQVSPLCNSTEYVNVCHHECRALCLNRHPDHAPSVCCICLCNQVHQAFKFEHNVRIGLYIMGAGCLVLLLSFLVLNIVEYRSIRRYNPYLFLETE